MVSCHANERICQTHELQDFRGAINTDKSNSDLFPAVHRIGLAKIRAKIRYANYRYVAYDTVMPYFRSSIVNTLFRTAKSLHKII